MKYPQACIVLFAKAPEAGKVKTRLIPALGEQGALDVHNRLLQRQIDVLNDSDLCHMTLWTDGDPGHPGFAAFAGRRRRQGNGDLGQRMLHAFRTLLAEFEHVVIIGSDCPGIDSDYLGRALKELAGSDDDGCPDAVIGPAEDGGYVLLGLRCVTPTLFEDIPWGGDTVLAQTRRRLQALGWRWRELPRLFDIDRPQDLAKL